jgi:hypothetical protein
MGQEDVIEQLLRRHRAFWEMEEVDRPLLSAERYQPLQPRQPIPLANGATTIEDMPLAPELIDPALLAGVGGQPSSLLAGEFIQGVAPYDLCWMEAMAGCPLHWKAGHVWSAPRGGFSPEGVERLRVAPENAWLDRLLHTTRLLVARAQGRYPVVQPLLRGPIDMAAAVLGDEPACLLMQDEPECFHCLLDVCTDNFIAVARAWMAASPPFRGGYCEYGIWAPGTVVRTQADNTALLSPRLYRDFLVPCDERLCAAFDYPLMHTHSCFIERVADALLRLEGLRAIQVSLDYPAGPPVAALLPTFQKINAQKPLIITGGLTEEELHLLLNTLSPRGLCLQVGIHD